MRAGSFMNESLLAHNDATAFTGNICVFDESGYQSCLGLPSVATSHDTLPRAPHILLFPGNFHNKIYRDINLIAYSVGYKATVIFVIITVLC